VEPELSPCVYLEKHTNSTNTAPIVIQKKKLTEPLPAFSPSLRLKEPQTKLTSLIPPEQLQEISWQDFWRSHAPRGASLFIYLFIYFFLVGLQRAGKKTASGRHDTN
jgi:hypothetical protein